MSFRYAVLGVAVLVGLSLQTPQATGEDPPAARWNLKKGDEFIVTWAFEQRTDSDKEDARVEVKMRSLVEWELAVEDVSEKGASCVATVRKLHQESVQGVHIEYEDGKLKRATGRGVEGEEEKARVAIGTPVRVTIDAEGKAVVTKEGFREFHSGFYLRGIGLKIKDGKIQEDCSIGGRGGIPCEPAYKGTIEVDGISCVRFATKTSQGKGDYTPELSLEVAFARDGFLVEKRCVFDLRRKNVLYKRTQEVTWRRGKANLFRAWESRAEKVAKAVGALASVDPLVREKAFLELKELDALFQVTQFESESPRPEHVWFYLRCLEERGTDFSLVASTLSKALEKLDAAKVAEIVRTLVERLTLADTWKAGSAAVALGWLQKHADVKAISKAFPVLLARLGDTSDARGQASSAVAIGRLIGAGRLDGKSIPQALDALFKNFLDTENREVREGTSIALSRASTLPGPFVEDVALKLVAYLFHEKKEVQDEASQALSLIGSGSQTLREGHAERVVDALIAKITDERTSPRADQAIRTLDRCLSDASLDRAIATLRRLDGTEKPGPVKVSLGGALGSCLRERAERRNLRE